jgi:hypothetical protein
VWHGSLLEFEKVHGHGTKNARHMEPIRRKKQPNSRGWIWRLNLLVDVEASLCVWISTKITNAWIGRVFQQV